MRLIFLAALIAVEPAAQAPGEDDAKPAERARANLGSYFSTDDYPPSAWARGAEGTVRFEVEIDPQGFVRNCRVTDSSQDAALDSATCSILLSRVRYSPARDARGRAIAGTDRGSVTWRLPELPPRRPFARLAVVSRLSSDGAGRIECSVMINGVAEADVGSNHCGYLAGFGAYEALRELTVPAEVTLVSVGGPADSGVEARAEDEGSYGDLQYDFVTELVIAQDGREVGCSVVARHIPSPAAAMQPTDPCEPLPPGAPPLFEASSNPAPRRARHRWTLYLKGWPIQALSTSPAPSQP